MDTLIIKGNLVRIIASCSPTEKQKQWIADLFGGNEIEIKYEIKNDI